MNETILKELRYCFEIDEDGHWYLIPLHVKKLFDILLYGDDSEKFEYEFSKFRLNGHISNYSFTDPIEDLD